MKIHSKQYDLKEGAKFSILIPSWNNLAYLQLCIRSLREHSSFPHQLIVHVNEGADGTLEWVRSERIDHTFSVENAGVCLALNAAAELATTDFIVFFNDDMYALPAWDQSLWQVIEAIPHRKWFLSSTMIEHRFTGNPCVLAPHDFGQGVADFREAELLANFKDLSMNDWCGSTWPPNIVPKALWKAVGGYSEEFSPGMSSDPDFSMKLWQLGVRHFQGIAASRVYHFQAKSTGKVKKNPGPKQFLQKWGITQGSFGKYYLRRGQAWTGPLPEAGPWSGLLIARIKSKLKRLFNR